MLDDGVYIAELILVTNAVNKKLTFVHCLHCFHARVSSLHLSISFTLQINTVYICQIHFLNKSIYTNVGTFILHHEQVRI